MRKQEQISKNRGVSFGVDLWKTSLLASSPLNTPEEQDTEPLNVQLYLEDGARHAASLRVPRLFYPFLVLCTSDCIQ